jgi:hypothetical protein
MTARKRRAGSIGAIALGVLAVWIVPAGTTHAQFSFWPRHGHWWSNHVPVRHSHRHRHASPKLAKKDQGQEAANGPLQIIISIPDQRISVYDNGALIARSTVSTGVRGHPTPRGVFSVISKQRWHRSNIYSGAPMPYMQRITWSGIALHAGVVPGHPASHGCIRLKSNLAVRLWHLTTRGTRVIIAPQDIQPVEIAHTHLFVSEPKAASAPPSDRAASADAAATADPAPPASMPDAGAQPVPDPPTASPTGTAAAPRKPAPVSVFVSRKLGKLFVRQGFRPLFDSPVTIQDPERSLGTHVFTVMASQNEGETRRWNAVSMPEGVSPAPSKRDARGKRSVAADPPAASPERASAALDRIEIPPDVVERIAKLLTPSSSLIVSDYGISAETGRDTDFIVITH